MWSSRSRQCLVYEPKKLIGNDSIIELARVHLSFACHFCFSRIITEQRLYSKR